METGSTHGAEIHAATLSGRLATLREKTAIEHVALLVCESAESARIVAADGPDRESRTRPGASFPLQAGALASRGARDVSDLGDEGKPLKDLGFSGIAFVALGIDGERVLLAAGGPSGKALRPRDLAELDALAKQLARDASSESLSEKLEGLDEQVRELDRLAALGSLVAEIVHEIRNPLVSVKTLLELLPEQGDDPELIEDFLPVALDEVRRVERLLENVLTHARPSSRSGNAAVGEAMTSVVGLLSQRARARVVELESDCEKTLPPAKIDDDSLRQVLLNLAINAIDASPEGGRVRIVARREGDRLTIDVSDEGPGVPKALREKLFEPFFSTKRDAAGGLGLAISKRLADACGGQLSVRDADGGGACFRLEVPAATSA